MTLDNIFEKHVKANFHSPDHHVYHYTSQTKLSQIIKSEYLKLNPHHFLNKKGNNDELKVGVELVLKMLEKFRLHDLMPKFKKYIEEDITFYTVSFSHEFNSAWTLEKYGARYIEFNPKFLQQFANDNRATLFGSVIYKKQLQEKIVSEMFGLFEEYKEKVPEPVVDLFTWLNLVIPFFIITDKRDYR